MGAPRSPRLTRLWAAAAATVLCIVLAACSAAPGPAGAGPTRESTPDSSRTAPAPAPSASASASGVDPGTGTDAAPDVDSDQPVEKVGRPGDPAAPTQEADPATTADPVTYPDGVSVRITDVSFGEETAKGPGSFPGRGYSRLTLELSNGSADRIDLGTSVLTVLDKDGGRVQPVYADEADVQDFAGTLASGATATAVYAFAIPEESMSQITLVVDFDAGHTSAVFRGGLD
ncbi:hypothetical protein [Microbacterium sp. SS28]|uniref:hypothetical protein n=1 Tax=Microbacterium sp. SS28 TaxID=2919948 RepID=UPI001FAA2B6A|nr:hypothetical protein [Microbacterium sp. SS28]